MHHPTDNSLIVWSIRFDIKCLASSFEGKPTHDQRKETGVQLLAILQEQTYKNHDRNIDSEMRTAAGRPIHGNRRQIGNWCAEIGKQFTCQLRPYLPWQVRFDIPASVVR